MIKSVTIQNFKNMRLQTIDFDRLTVFVGANASGKTSVLEAVALAVNADRRNPKWEELRDHEIGWLYTRGGIGDLAITCETAGGQFTLKGFMKAEPGKAPAWELDLSGAPGSSVEEAQGSVRPLVLLDLNAAQVAKPSYSGAERPKLESDGSGAASVLAFMALNDPDAFQELMEHMRELVPQFQRIRFRRSNVFLSERDTLMFTAVGNEGERRILRSYQGEAILFDFKNATDVSAHTVSSGTLLILGLLTVLLGPDHPKVLLMDDIDHGLHPLAQKALLGSLHKVMSKFPDLQVLATAHSPYLLDHLRPAQIRLMTTGSDGYSVCGRLDQHPEYERWKDEMTPGELWSLFGENWVASKGTTS